MWSILYVSAFVAAGFLPLTVQHTSLHGFSSLQASLALFCAINVLICIWEMGLFINRARIRAEFAQFKRQAKNTAWLPQPMFLFAHCSLRQALTLEYWSLVWSTYSLIDPSYSDQTTFGFWVDVGNGFTTIVPTILFALCMTWPLLPARVVGLISMIKFYQEFYGTIIYFSSFLLNERYKGKSTVGIAIVVLANNVWCVFPAIGMYACWHLIDSNNYAIFNGAWKVVV